MWSFIQANPNATNVVILLQFGKTNWYEVFLQSKYVILLGTIKGVDTLGGEWFYKVCMKCKFKMNNFKCSNESCSSELTAGVKWFKIPIRVQDSTGTVTITLFDHDSKKLLGGETMEDLIKSNDEVTPNEMSIDVQDRHATEYASLALKDCISSTRDNVTPLSEGNASHSKKVFVEETSDDCFVTGFKLTLDYVYEEDESNVASASKQRSSNKVAEGVVKLIVPKVEKYNALI